MPGPLKNERHERFAQGLAGGSTQIASYRDAGYSYPDETAACRLAKRPEVRARINEILDRAAKRAEVTIHTIADQLDDDRDFARDLEAPAAAISATMGKAKVYGLLADRVEHTGKDGGPIETRELTDEEAARRIAFTLSRADKRAPTAH